jgi:phage replication-related protein YjqB (UPF0714/DUF867 family)
MSLDRYSSLTALKQGKDKSCYRIRLQDRRSLLTVIAPHGGFIEAGTSELAHAIAKDKFNLFDFQGLQREAPQDLHVTATRFRDPHLCELLRTSLAAVALHGMHDQSTREIFLGGLNFQLKELVLQELLRSGFEVNPHSPLYRGVSRANIVNLAGEHGVQLEIPNELFAELFAGDRFHADGRCPPTTTRFNALVHALRKAMQIYLEDKVVKRIKSSAGQSNRSRRKKPMELAESRQTWRRSS